MNPARQSAKSAIRNAIGRLRGLAATGRIPRHDGELVRERFELDPPHPAVTDGAVHEEQCRTATTTAVRDGEVSDGHVVHGGPPS